ncbi:MAG: hypothetical protein EKK61_05750 [Rickettsiales bacterium]|nr:MAG: hypothetical protein EKK61_05750 [Rickettsiales bacterium]
MIYFTSDLHFFHKNILKFTKRPFENLEEMHESIIENWNSIITNSDTVYHLGDLHFEYSNSTIDEFLKIMGRLNGKIFFIKGNHDREITFKLLKETYPKFDYINSPYYELKVKNYCKEKIVLCHYPITFWNGGDRGSIHLHGHTHNCFNPEEGRILDVGYDSLYEKFGMLRPISLEEVIEYMETRTIVKRVY